MGWDASIFPDMKTKRGNIPALIAAAKRQPIVFANENWPVIKQNDLWCWLVCSCGSISGAKLPKIRWKWATIRGGQLNWMAFGGICKQPNNERPSNWCFIAMLCEYLCIHRSDNARKPSRRIPMAIYGSDFVICNNNMSGPFVPHIILKHNNNPFHSISIVLSLRAWKQSSDGDFFLTDR